MKTPKAFNDFLKDLDTVADILGKPIDDKIKIPVAALRYSGIETEQSCEGHLDHGEPYPWISVLCKNEDERKAAWSKAFDYYDEQLKSKEGEFTVGKPIDDDTRKKLDTYHGFINDAKKIDALNFLQMHSLLINFYDSEGISDYDSILVFNHFRIEPQGGIYQHGRSLSDKKKYLEKYQNEFIRFAIYLRSTK